MYTIKKTSEFDEWIDNLKDRTTKFKLLRRLEKAKRGLLGDISPVGEGVFEMREFFGPGWRMYYILTGATIIVMLGGGDKSSQKEDIKIAKQLASSLLEQ